MNREDLVPTSQPEPEYYSPRLSQHPFLIQIGAPLILFVTIIFLVEIVVSQEKQHTLDQHIGRLADNTSELKTLFETELNSTIYLATGLVSYIQSKQGQINVGEIDPWLINLQERAEHVRNIGIAPNNRLDYIYPIVGNEAALGMYYPDNKEQWPAVEKNIRSRRAILAGPVNLRQGGRGLIYRAPVFINDNYWGLVSTVLNFDSIYRIIEQRAKELNIRINVTDLDGEINPLFGDTLMTPQFNTRLSIPGRQWKLNAESASPLNVEQADQIRLIGWISSFLLTSMLYFLLKNFQNRQEISHALHNSQARFAQIFRNAPQGILLINATGQIESANQSLAETLGYSLAEISQKNFFELLAPSQRDRINNIIEGIIPLGAHNNPYESVLIDKSGANIYVVLSLSPASMDNSNEDWIIQIIDISYRISYERLLHEEAGFKQTLINIIPEALLIVNQQGLITASNTAAHYLFGAEHELLSGCRLDQVLMTQNHESLLSKLHTLGASQLVHQMTLGNIQGFKLSGKVMSVEVAVATVARKNESFYVISIKELKNTINMEPVEIEKST